MLRRAAVFHAVASCGSLSEAARRLGRSTPAIHHDLKCLERELGRPLYEREGRSIRLSSGARRLFEGLSRNLDEIGRQLEWFSRGDEEGEVVRLAAVSGFARYRLASLLFAEAGAGPIALITGSHEQVLEALVSGAADAAITYRPVTAIPLQSVELAREEYVLLGPSGSPPIASLGEVEALGLVTYDEYEYVFAQWFEGAFGRQPGRLVRSDHATELEEALEAVAAGRGATIVPADAWTNGPWAGRCARLFDGRPVTNALYLLTLAGTAPAAAAKLGSLFGRD